jgi:hypothetical protein
MDLSQIPEFNAEYLIAGLLTPFLSAVIRNAKWGAFAKAMMTKVVVGISTIALSILHGKMNSSELLGGIWIYVVSCLVEPQFRSSILRYIEETTTVWAEQASAKIAKNYDKYFVPKQEVTVEVNPTETISSSEGIDYDKLAILIAEKMSKKS